jgi:hypothetical protein
MKILKLFIGFILLLNSASSQNCSISIYVKDSETGEYMIGASVYNQYTKTGGVTNSAGFYSITLKMGQPVKITADYIGYESAWKSFTLLKDTVLHFNLKASNELETVTVSAERNANENTSGSVLKIPIEVIKTMPSLSGETDVMKVFQLMPGVQSGQEGTSSLYVRGGSPDQNLYLVDDVPLYYVNHLGGFVSIFDDNAINTMELIKGGFPARYGGRLSSVIDMRMKNGNQKEFHGEIKLGALSSKLFIEGPIKKDKTTFMLSFRRSNIDLFTRIQTSLTYEGFTGAYTFYDLYGKIRHKFSDKSTIFISIYSGRDRLSIIDKQKSDHSDGFGSDDPLYTYESFLYNKWGNQMASFKWNIILNQRLFSNLSISYSRFYYNNEQEYLKKDSVGESILERDYAAYLSGINDLTGKYDFDFFPTPNHKIKFGIHVIRHEFSPGINRYIENSGSAETDTIFGNKRIATFESYVYVEDDFKIGKLISGNIGLLGSYYDASGTIFRSGQPRFNLNFKLSKYWIIKTSYSKIQQNLHLLSNSGTGIPTDIWLPPSSTLKPEISDQYTLNLSHTIPSLKSEISLEAFYKEMQHLIDFKEGASYQMVNSDWNSVIEPSGLGRVYGLEFLLQKKSGKITGWVAYTLSKNERRFEHINGGSFYPSTFDRRHDIAVVFNYRLSKRISLSADWVYSSGNMMTLALANYQIQVPEWYYNSSRSYVTYEDLLKSENVTAYYYGGKNNFRLPSYHRLDLNVTFEKQKKRGLRTWQVGIYNAYCQKNIFFLYYKNNGKDLYKFTLFPIIPSFSYSFKF